MPACNVHTESINRFKAALTNVTVPFQAIDKYGRHGGSLFNNKIQIQLVCVLARWRLNLDDDGRRTDPVVGPAHASTAGCVMKLVCSGNLGIDIENVIEQLCAIYDVDGATSSS